MKPIRTLVFLFLLLNSLSSCKQGQETPPIPEQKMQDILVDMHLAETYSQGLGDSVKNKFEKNYDSLATFYTSILRHYNLSLEEFNEALQWYKERPVLIDSLYGRALIRLTEIKAHAGLKDVDTDHQSSSSSGTDTIQVKNDSVGNNALLKANSIKNNKKDTAKRRDNLSKPVTQAEP